MFQTTQEIMNGTHLKIILNQQEQQWEEIRKAGRYGSNCSGLEQLGLTRKQSHTYKKVASIQTDILTLPPWKG